MSMTVVDGSRHISIDLVLYHACPTDKEGNKFRDDYVSCKCQDAGSILKNNIDRDPAPP